MAFDKKAAANISSDLAHTIGAADLNEIEPLVQSGVEQLIQIGCGSFEAKVQLSAALIKEGQINFATTSNVEKALKLLK